jgi:hypothetical protein
MSGNGFFRIDRRTWAAVCDLGMNPAVAYLVLACGTGRDNRTTSWSAQAVAEYAGIAWLRGKPAIQDLCKAGFIQQTKTGTRPRYALFDWIEIEEARRAKLPQLGGNDAMVYGEIASGNQPKGTAQRRTADKLVQAGRLWVCGGNYVAQPPIDDTQVSDHYIWLPKTLVTGTEAGEDSPLARLRRAQDVLTLRLFIDLYHAQHLRDDGGVSRVVVYQKYERVRVGEHGIYVVWSFSPKTCWAKYHSITSPHFAKQANGEAILWARMRQLQEQGLLEFVPHLCEAVTPDAELIHTYGIDWSEKGLSNPENAGGRAAHLAGLAMCKKGQNGLGRFLAPVSRDYADAQMVGIVRLRYRPHTKRTSQWWAVQQTRIPGLIKHYEALREKASSRLEIKGNQGESRLGIKGA